jgi:NAD(P)-dependent dehydrogenase (short-subunit alcohol dehydrogenase family)
MNIIVNGGTRGIGRETAINLAQDINNHIIVTGRNESLLNELSAGYKNILVFPLDISVIDIHVKDFLEMVSSRLRTIDILINVAGFLVAKGFLETTDDEARVMMETNFFGPASLIRALKPIMPAGSHIINISSMGGFQGSIKYNGLSYYSASKAALACLTECLSNEFKDFGISVNCLALGAVQTEMLAESFPGYKASVSAKEMAEFISGFALTGHKYFNGKILPVAIGNP